MGKRKRWVWGLYNHVFVDLGLEGGRDNREEGREAEKLEVFYFYFFYYNLSLLISYVEF